MIKKAVYIGAGEDVSVYLLKHIDEFISIDGEPNFSNGIFSHKNDQTYIDRWFVNFIKKMNQIDYRLVNKVMGLRTINKLVFKNNKNQTVKYYHTIFPKLINDEICRELSDVNIIIDIGHHPHPYILKLIKQSKFDIICRTGCVYTSDPDPNTCNNIFDNSLTELLERVENWYLIIDNREYNYIYTFDTNISVIRVADYYKLIEIERRYFKPLMIT